MVLVDFCCMIMTKWNLQTWIGSSFVLIKWVLKSSFSCLQNKNGIWWFCCCICLFLQNQKIVYIFYLQTFEIWSDIMVLFDLCDKSHLIGEEFGGDSCINFYYFQALCLLNWTRSHISNHLHKFSLHTS